VSELGVILIGKFSHTSFQNGIVKSSPLAIFSYKQKVCIYLPAYVNVH